MKHKRLIWAIWILVLGVSLIFIHAIPYLNSFSEYLRAFGKLDMPSSWCPTFLTLYGLTTLIALAFKRKNRFFNAISKITGVILFPIGIYTLYIYTADRGFVADFEYFYAQTIHLSEFLTGAATLYILAVPPHSRIYSI